MVTGEVCLLHTRPPNLCEKTSLVFSIQESELYQSGKQLDQGEIDTVLYATGEEKFEFERVKTLGTRKILEQLLV
jgi:hypothetical protein